MKFHTAKNGAGVTLQTLIVAFLFVSLLVVLGGSVQACPCNTVTVPESDPQYNNTDGLQFSRTRQYRQEFESAISAARLYCEKHKNVSHRAIVSDIDETLFDNREFDSASPQFDRSKWMRWVAEERAPVHKLTANFLSWARSQGFAVFLVTTRGEDTRINTIYNLVRDSVAYDGLFMRPAGNKQTHQALKTAFRKQIQEEGFTIVVNLGDQFSDLAGGYADDCEKLPNRMYFHR